MVERGEGSQERTFMREMTLSDADIERRKKFVGLEPGDVQRVTSLKNIVVQHASELTQIFLDFLRGLEETRNLMRNHELVERVRQLKTEHLIAMVQGDYGVAYVEQRVKLALLYSKAGIHPRVFLGAFHQLLRGIGDEVMKQHERSPMEGFHAFMSLKKVAFFDIGVIIDALMVERERVIRQQQDAIRELSTPVLQIRERLLLLPIIGVIDTHRAQLITENLLRAIRVNRARVAVMDVTGVATIDSRVANHLLQTVNAARLMGALVIVTGVSAEVAQSLVGLGINVSMFNTMGDLQGGVEEAERMLGYRVVASDSAATPST